MAQKKKTSSPVLDKANSRLAGIKSIDSALDLGDGFSTETYQAAINDLQQKQNDYNTILSLVDERHYQMMQAEKNLSTMSERMLIKVSAKFGKDSDQYEKAGGVRKSLVKKRTVKKPSLTNA